MKLSARRRVSLVRTSARVARRALRSSAPFPSSVPDPRGGYGARP